MRDLDRDLAHLHRALAEHVRRDQPLAKALAIVSDEFEDRRLRRAVVRIREALEAGSPAGEAWAQGAPCVPALYGALIEAASGSGDVANALDQIAEHAARSSTVNERLRQALFGPVVTALACLGFGILTALMAGPSLMALTDVINGSSPLPIAAIGVGILVLLVVGAIVLTRMRSPMAKGRFGVPVIGPLRLQAVRADIASTLALLLRRGVALPTAAAFTAETTPPGRAHDGVVRMQARASEGASVREALDASGLYEGSTLWLVEAADGSADIVEALDDVADVYRRRMERGIDRMGVVARPVAEVVIGVAVFFFAFSYIGPVLDLVKWIRIS